MLQVLSWKKKISWKKFNTSSSAGLQKRRMYVFNEMGMRCHRMEVSKMYWQELRQQRNSLWKGHFASEHSVWCGWDTIKMPFKKSSFWTRIPIFQINEDDCCMKGVLGRICGGHASPGECASRTDWPFLLGSGKAKATHSQEFHYTFMYFSPCQKCICLLQLYSYKVFLSKDFFWIIRFFCYNEQTDVPLNSAFE